MMKKGQGISINVIIIAAIALLVLVILAVLVIRASTNTDEKTKTCTVQGGKCQAEACTGDQYTASDCTGSTPNCCAIFSTG